MWISVKLFGCVLVFSACVMCGMHRGAKARMRAQLLKEMARFLACVQTELIYRKNRSLTLLQNAARAEERRVLHLDFSGSEAPPEIIRRETQRLEVSLRPLTTEEERRIFFDALHCVGTQEASEQAEQLRGAQRLLEQAEAAAEDKAAEETRIFRTLGVCAGCAAVLFLL